MNMKNENDWKGNLSEILTENKLFRIKYLNEILLKVCKEWTNHINEFDWVAAKWKTADFSPPEYEIEVNLRRLPEMPFKIRFGYSLDESETKVVLKLKYATGIDVKKAINTDEGPLIYEYDVIEEPEMVFDTYVLQLINNCFRNWLNKMRSRFPEQ
jgi:hypothetical protein